jgi:uncharacterized protein (TIGR03000 family)
MRTIPAVGFSTLLLLGATAAAQAAAPASIEMIVPADARVWIGDEATTPQGAERHFVTPSLEVGARYYYVIRVQWTEGGKTLERSRRVSFVSGDQIRIDLVQTDAPTLDVTVTRSVPAPARVSPTISAYEPYPGFSRYEPRPSFSPGLNSGSLSGPGPAGLERR